MKAHVGVDSKTKLIHTILASAANVPDVDALPYLLHGRETRVWGDQGYQGRTAVIHKSAPNAKDFTNRRYRRNADQRHEYQSLASLDDSESTRRDGRNSP